MTLTLEVTGPKGAALGAGRRMVFDQAGGTIGRSPGNATHWVLPDPHVSSTHAVIRWQQGSFTIEDRSRNGTFLNSLENRLPHGEAHPLKNGDTIFIDPFDVRVSIGAPAASSYDAADPFAEPLDRPARGSSRPPTGAWPAADDPILPPLDPAVDSGGTPSGDSVMRGLGLPGRPAPPPKVPSSKDLWGQQAWNDNFSPPQAEPPPAPPRHEAPPDIPTDWDREMPSLRPSPPVRRPEPPPAPHDTGGGSWHHEQGQGARPSREPSRPAGRPSLPGRRPVVPRAPADEPSSSSRAAARIDVDEIFRGAGLDPASLTPEVARVLGQIFRVVVQGTMDVLHARRALQEEFRMDKTIFEPVGANNPLKFSAGVDDALHNLFVRRSPGYLGPVAAFEDAFGDMRYHELAMLQGMRMAFESMLEQFDPAKLEAAFDREQKKGARLAVPLKPRYWELYGERFRDMVRDAETAFRELFGDEFRAAYREQLSRLKAQGRSGKT